VDDFTLGSLRPREPFASLPAATWGANLTTFEVEGTIDGVAYVSESWRDVRERAGIDPLVDGRTYTLVAIGPSVELETKGFWNDFAFALIDNDPELPDGN
jgi:hypothetical protein